jgi:hypothetical protein
MTIVEPPIAVVLPWAERPKEKGPWRGKTPEAHACVVEQERLSAYVSRGPSGWGCNSLPPAKQSGQTTKEKGPREWGNPGPKLGCAVRRG